MGAKLQFAARIAGPILARDDVVVCVDNGREGIYFASYDKVHEQRIAGGPDRFGWVEFPFIAPKNLGVGTFVSRRTWHLARGGGQVPGVDDSWIRCIRTQVD